MNPLLYTGDIFRLQARGGITRYFLELIPRLSRPHRVVAGLHQSVAVRDGKLPAEAAWYMPEFRLSPRPRAAINAWIDSGGLRGGDIETLHPTYYRDPSSLPVGRPVVLTVHDMAHERFPELFRRHWWNSPDPARFKRAIVERADRIVCVSESTKRDLVEFFKIDERKVRTIHHGATDWTRVTPEPVRALEGRPFFLWIGERHTYKNFAATLEAWRESSAASSTSILCAGGSPLHETGTVQLPLGDAQLRWAYEHAVALLYTSRCEGFGLPLVEAMSLGCPVVTSNVSSMPEVAGDVAIYVDPTDTESIRAGIEQAFTTARDPSLVERLKARASHFSWDRCAEAHEAVYRELD